MFLKNRASSGAMSTTEEGGQILPDRFGSVSIPTPSAVTGFGDEVSAPRHLESHASTEIIEFSIDD